MRRSRQTAVVVLPQLSSKRPSIDNPGIAFWSPLMSKTFFHAENAWLPEGWKQDVRFHVDDGRYLAGALLSVRAGPDLVDDSAHGDLLGA